MEWQTSLKMLACIPVFFPFSQNRHSKFTPALEAQSTYWHLLVIFIFRRQISIGKLDLTSIRNHTLQWYIRFSQQTWNCEWALGCLTSPSRWSAIFSSESGSASFLSRPPWMWSARLTPAVATTRARRVTIAAVSMVSKRKRRFGWIPLSEADEGFWSSNCTCWLQKAPREQRKELVLVKRFGLLFVQEPG